MKTWLKEEEERKDRVEAYNGKFWPPHEFGIWLD